MKKSNGTIDKFKIDIFSKGSTQIEGVEYFKTISLVVRFTSDMELFQMDLKIAFLNGHLKYEIYMQKHVGYTIPKYEEKVYNLKTSITV